MGLRTTFTGHKGPRLNTIVLFYQRVPNYLQKVGQHTRARTHTRTHSFHTQKCRGEMVATVTAAATALLSAQSGSAMIAQRRTSPVHSKVFDSAKTTFILCYYFYFIFILRSFCLPSSGSGSEPERRADARSHGTICIAPHYPRKSPFTRSYCQTKRGGKRHDSSNKGGQLRVIRGKS